MTTSDWSRFGDAGAFEIAVRWEEDQDPLDRRPAGHGWSMGGIELVVLGRNLTENTLNGDRVRHVQWYLSPVLDWIVTNWVELLHEEHFAWRERTGLPAAVACRRALERWRRADDNTGRENYEKAQVWYKRHGLRSAVPGAVFPDLFIRRCGDDIELSWTDDPPQFARDGLSFASRAEHVRLPVAEVARPFWDVLQWVVAHPPEIQEVYREEWTSLSERVKGLNRIDPALFDRANVATEVLDSARDAFSSINRMDLFDDRRSANDLFVEEFSPAVAMFGGMSSALALPDIKTLRDTLVDRFPGQDNEELSELVRTREGLPLGTPYQDAVWFAADLLEDLDEPGDQDFVDVHAICERLEISIEEIQLLNDSIRGVALAGEGLSPKILINVSHPYNNNDGGKRFTVGHELCHILFDRSRARRITHISGSWAPPGVERRANAFAAYLLMPRGLVMKHLPVETKPDTTQIRRLSGAMKVNESALVEHLYNLDLIDDVEREKLRFFPSRRQ